MSKLNYKEIARYNEEEREMRKNLPTLFESMQMAAQGDITNVELQVMYQRKTGRFTEEGITREYEYKKLKVMNKKLNYLLNEMIRKYCDNTNIIVGGKHNNQGLQMNVSNQVFEQEEMEFMFANFITNFHHGVVKYWSYKQEEIVEIKVPPLENFTYETIEKSNNHLVKYIIDYFEKIVVLKMMEIEFDIREFMQDGVRYYVKQEIETVSFEDVRAGEDENGETLTLTDILADPRSEIDGVATVKQGLQKSGRYIFDKYKDVMLPNQLDKFERLLEAIESGQISLDEIFHPLTGEMNLDAIGRVLFPDKKNNYHQQSNRNWLNSMRSRMKKALEKEGLLNKVELKSDYRKFPNLSAEENRLYAEYEIDKKIIKEFDYEQSDMYKNVKTFKDNRVIPQSKIDEIAEGKMTVSELIEEYGITKGNESREHGDTYIYDSDGKLIEIKGKEGKKKGGYVNIQNLEIKDRGDNLDRVM